MRPFSYIRSDTTADALRAALAGAEGDGRPTAAPESQFLAGGTNLVDMMKLDVVRPARLVDINGLPRDRFATIESTDAGLRLGALVRMAEAADHPAVKQDFPVIAQALQLAASAQIRNMASLGGNVLQRTRCSYFRDVSYSNCNKRIPGSGCAAMNGVNRKHAVLGASEQCIATYPGDFAQALVALDAKVMLAGPQGERSLDFAKLHKAPGETPHIETQLRPGEMITGYEIARAPWTRRSHYLKIRDRESYEFALASAAVALDIEDGTIRQARIALGGVPPVPWPPEDAESALPEQPAHDKAFETAARFAFTTATPRIHNAYKIALGKRTVLRALRQAAALQI
jgi:xanthine dehydrogenase YagS FAD-binding subunit